MAENLWGGFRSGVPLMAHLCSELLASFYNRSPILVNEAHGALTIWEQLLGETVPCQAAVILKISNLLALLHINVIHKTKVIVQWLHFEIICRIWFFTPLRCISPCQAFHEN